MSIDILVCGGRDYDDERRVFEELDIIHAKRVIRFLVEGGASGADWLAYQWARARFVPCVSHFADWAKYGGAAAGPIRNREMLRLWGPTLVLAFPGGNGTRNMVMQAQHQNIEVIEIKRDGG